MIYLQNNLMVIDTKNYSLLTIFLQSPQNCKIENDAGEGYIFKARPSDIPNDSGIYKSGSLSKTLAQNQRQNAET